MPKYIDADKFEEQLMLNIRVNQNSKYIDGLLRAFNIFNSQPAAEVRPIVYGRWKGCGLGDYRCSLCSEEISGTKNFCPNCGAVMAGGGIDNE